MTWGDGMDEHDQLRASVITNNELNRELLNRYEQIRTLEDENKRLRNGLKWIRQSAMIHYLGDALDPIHFEELAHQAQMALDGEPVDDFDEAWAKAKVKAAEWKELFSGDP